MSQRAVVLDDSDAFDVAMVAMILYVVLAVILGASIAAGSGGSRSGASFVVAIWIVFVWILLVFGFTIEFAGSFVLIIVPSMVLHIVGNGIIIFSLAGFRSAVNVFLACHRSVTHCCFSHHFC